MADTLPDRPSELFSLTQIQHLMRVEFSRAQRYGYPVAVLVVEVDGLDRRRDAHGFEARQDALAQAARVLESTTRSCDYLGRLVDDRFLAVLPHTGAKGAERTAERLLAVARETKLARSGDRLTLSAGVAAYERQDTLFFDALVEAAEEALAEARAGGGDRYVVRAPGRSAGEGAAR